MQGQNQPQNGPQPTGGQYVPPQPQPGYAGGMPPQIPYAAGIPPQQPYAPPVAPYPAYPGGPAMVMPPFERGRGLAVGGLVLGIISAITWWYPPLIFMALPVSIIGIVLSALGRRSVTRRTMANWGLGLSITGLTLLLCFWFIIILVAAGQHSSTP